jgi:hypothetical protein
MTGFTVGPTGGIMCPQVLPVSGNYRIRQWGWTWTNFKANGGVRANQFYWQCDYLFGTQIANPGWVGPGSQARPGIHYMEVWWDSAGGWLATDGSAPTAPWINGSPAIPDITYLGYGAFGQWAGTLWRHMYPTYKVSLSNVISTVGGS